MPILLTIHPSLAQEQQQHLAPLMQGWDGQFENFISMPGSLAQHVGALLMNMLIPGLDEGVKSLLAAQQEAQAQGTTVQLSLVSEAAEVQALPWELLFHPELKFLTTHPDFTFLRRFARPDDEVRVPAPLPLRVLLCIASPEDLDPERSRLDFENEENFLFEQIADAYGRGVIDIDVAEDGTLKTLEQRLMSQHYHILHLSMHGRMTEAGPVLAFEDDATGRTRLVEPETLLSLWKKGASRVPCIVLSACQTAQADTERAIPSFTQVLIQQGVPHVIGMRRSVADTAATYFAGYFYRAVAEGLPIDRAVVEARRAVQQQGLGMQWTVPALFSRKASLACADATQPFTPVRGYLPKMLQIGDVSFQQEGFIGRRATIRRHYRKWADGQTPYLLFHGTGGVGKTTIAGHFAFRYLREHKNARIFALAPPFEADRMEALLDDAFNSMIKFFLLAI